MGSSQMLYHWATGDSVLSKGQIVGLTHHGSLLGIFLPEGS